MTSPPSPSPPNDYVIPPRYWAWLGTRRAIVVILWIAAVVTGAALTYRAFTIFDSPEHDPERRRADGNGGHTQIDFGGQYVMGRMVVTGNGRRLYDRNTQWRIVRDSYPVADEAPIQREEAPLPKHLRARSRPGEDWQHDANNLMSWFIGSEEAPSAGWKTLGGATGVLFAQPLGAHPLVAVAHQKAAADAVTPAVVAQVNEPAVGGPLYPPVHALFYAPLALIDRPQRAYHVLQVFCVLLVPVTALGVKVLTRGRIWWSVATLLLFLYPGMRGGLDLGQNPSITVCIAVWGWALASRGYDTAGGVVWGLFAFKPVWAAAFLLVPLLTRRWRLGLAMAATGAALCAVTLPVVGIESWWNWLHIGKEASELYKLNDNWIHLSRDLQGLPRRALLDFTRPVTGPNPLIDGLAWGIWAAVLVATVLVYVSRADRRRATGTGTAFLLLGAYLTCFHFMYYDALVSAVALAALFAEPKRFLGTTAFAVEPVPAEPRVPTDRALPPAAPQPAPRPRFGARMLGYANSFPLTIVVALFVVENSLVGIDLEATVGARYFATPATDGGTGAKVPQLRAGTGVRYPLDTYLLILIWAWCGWRLLREKERGEVPPGTGDP